MVKYIEVEKNIFHDLFCFDKTVYGINVGSDVIDHAIVIATQTFVPSPDVAHLCLFFQ